MDADLLRRLRDQPVDSHRLHAFNLPDDFLRRVADHMIREEYQGRTFAVIDDTTPPPPASSAGTPSSASASGPEAQARSGSAKWAWMVGSVLGLAIIVVAARTLGASRPATVPESKPGQGGKP